jgi:ubiquinone/menaquinone biosynthesis C-methylase UbiE
MAYQSYFSDILKRTVFYKPDKSIKSSHDNIEKIGKQEANYANLSHASQESQESYTSQILQVSDKNNDFNAKEYDINQYKIYAVLQEASKNKEYYERFKSVILSYFYLDLNKGKEFLKYLVEQINESVNNNTLISDLDLCKKLNSFYQNNILTPDFKSKLHTHTHSKRGKNIARSILKLLTEEQQANIKDYLDFDCFDCEITRHVKYLLKIEKEHAYGVDIAKYSRVCDEITFSQISPLVKGNEPEPLSFSANSFDLITCLMVLHHLPHEHLEFILQEFYRILRPNGILIIKEHNVPSDVYLKYIIDIQHMLYDFVWNTNTITWEQPNPINYMSNTEWQNLLQNANFTLINQAPFIADYKKNAVNKFTIVYQKPVKIASSETGSNKSVEIYHKLFRKFTFDMARREYKQTFGGVKNTKHWGQFKLFLMEVEFLTLYFKKQSKKYSDSAIIVYAGAAPGTHILLLSKLFPNLQWDLYDPNKFDTKLAKNKKIHTYNEYFTDETASQWTQSKHTLDILFISDIRTADPTKMSAGEVEERVKVDHEMQEKWYKIMQPAGGAMLKFRLPWDNNITQYIKGEIYIQPYAPLSSTETRLIVLEPTADTTEYDNKAYEEIMFNFNQNLRIQSYENIFQDIPEDQKCGLNNGYDAASAIHILSEYLRLANKKINLKHICEIINNLYKIIPQRKISDEQPLSIYQKQRIRKLKDKNFIPADAPLNQETYSTYVLPNIVKYLEDGIL